MEPRSGAIRGNYSQGFAGFRFASSGLRRLLQMNRKPEIDPADLRNREAELKAGTTVEVSGPLIKPDHASRESCSAEQAQGGS
jgi:hypothetical protein